MHETVKTQPKDENDILALMWIECAVKFEIGSLTRIERNFKSRLFKYLDRYVK